MINKIEKAILTMLWIGYFKYAPGTAASFITCLIFYIHPMGGIELYVLFFLIVMTIYSVILIDKVYKKEDSEEIVIDEFVGQSIPLIAWYFRADFFGLTLPHSFWLSSSLFEFWIVASFILFRIFDIIKPFPINIVDKKIKNGLGVMLDDIIAGIYSTIILYIIYLLV